jgi:hypothetical protein
LSSGAVFDKMLGDTMMGMMLVIYTYAQASSRMPNYEIEAVHCKRAQLLAWGVSADLVTKG